MEVEVFNPVHRYVNRIYFNYRDHRKIAVIDGRARLHRRHQHCR